MSDLSVGYDGAGAHPHYDLRWEGSPRAPAADAGVRHASHGYAHGQDGNAERATGAKPVGAERVSLPAS